MRSTPGPFMIPCNISHNISPSSYLHIRPPHSVSVSHPPSLPRRSGHRPSPKRPPRPRASSPAAGVADHPRCTYLSSFPPASSIIPTRLRFPSLPSKSKSKSSPFHLLMPLLFHARIQRPYHPMLPHSHTIPYSYSKYKKKAAYLHRFNARISLELERRCICKIGRAHV